MGMVTPVLIRHDFLHEISEDRDFGKRIADSITYEEFGNVNNEYVILPCSHASNNRVIVSGGNMIRDIGFASETAKDDLDIIKQLAEKHGYKLVKK